MRITPLDIQQMIFKVRIRGYDRKAVDQFLEEIAQTMETLNRENSVLREKLSGADQHLAELKRTESTLTHTLVSTQAMAEDLKQIAKRDAELIIKEAELKAADILRAGREEQAAVQREILELRKQRVLAIERLRATLHTFERILEIETGDGESPPTTERGERVESLERLTAEPMPYAPRRDE